MGVRVGLPAEKNQHTQSSISSAAEGTAREGRGSDKQPACPVDTARPSAVATAAVPQMPAQGSGTHAYFAQSGGIAPHRQQQLLHVNYNPSFYQNLPAGTGYKQQVIQPPQYVPGETRTPRGKTFVYLDPSQRDGQSSARP